MLYLYLMIIKNMKFLTYISVLLIAVFAASCTKVAPLNKIEDAKAQSNTPEKTAIIISPDNTNNNGAGITDPGNDEDHDKDAIKVY